MYTWRKKILTALLQTNTMRTLLAHRVYTLRLLLLPSYRYVGVDILVANADVSKLSWWAIELSLNIECRLMSRKPMQTSFVRVSVSPFVPMNEVPSRSKNTRFCRYLSFSTAMRRRKTSRVDMPDRIHKREYNPSKANMASGKACCACVI